MRHPVRATLTLEHRLGSRAFKVPRRGRVFVQFSPDGRALWAHNDTHLMGWSIASGESLGHHRLAHAGRGDFAMTVRADGVYSVGHEGAGVWREGFVCQHPVPPARRVGPALAAEAPVAVWGRATLSVARDALATVRAPRSASRHALSADGRWCLAFDDEDATLALASLTDRRGWRRTLAHQVIDAHIAANRFVLVHTAGPSLETFDLVTGAPCASLADFGPDDHAVLDPRGDHVLVQRGAALRLLRGPELSLIWQKELPFQDFTVMALSPDASAFALDEGHQGTLAVLSTETLHTRCGSVGPGAPIARLALDSDDTAFALGQDCELWRVSVREAAFEPLGALAEVAAMAVSPDRQRLALGHDWGPLHLVDPHGLDAPAVLRAGPGFWALAFSPDGDALDALEETLDGLAFSVWSRDGAHRTTRSLGVEPHRAPDGAVVPAAAPAAVARHAEGVWIAYNDRLADLSAAGERVVFRVADGGFLRSAGFDPDTRRGWCLEARYGEPATVLTVVALDTGEVIASQPCDAQSAVAGPGLRWVACLEGAALVLRSSAHATPLATLQLAAEDDALTALAPSPSGRTLAVGTSLGELLLVRVALTP